MRKMFWLLGLIVLGAGCSDTVPAGNPPPAPVKVAREIRLDSARWGNCLYEADPRNPGASRLVGFDYEIGLSLKDQFGERYRQSWEAEYFVYGSNLAFPEDAFLGDMVNSQTCYGRVNGQTFPNRKGIMKGKLKADANGIMTFHLGSRKGETPYRNDTIMRPIYLVVRVIRDPGKPSSDIYFGSANGPPNHRLVYINHIQQTSFMVNVQSPESIIKIWADCEKSWRDKGGNNDNVDPPSQQSLSVPGQISFPPCFACDWTGGSLDADGDLIVDCLDGCPNDPKKVAPGPCGCGAADVDTDSDGVFDCHDACPRNQFVSAFPCTPYGDIDYDGDVDAEDVSSFQVCLGLGEWNQPPLVPECRVWDLTRDGVTNQADWTLLQSCLSRSGLPGPCVTDPTLPP